MGAGADPGLQLSAFFLHYNTASIKLRKREVILCNIDDRRTGHLLVTHQSSGAAGLIE